MQVDVLQGTIFSGGVDLTVLPCSPKPSVSSLTRDRIEHYNLANPLNFRYPLGLGDLSKLYNFRHKSRRTKHYVFAASALNNRSDIEILFKIGKKLGELASQHAQIRSIETPLLGSGAGGLSQSASLISLASGVQETAPDDLRMIVYTFNEALRQELLEALSSSRAEKIAQMIKLSPSVFGVGVDLNGVKMRVARAISRSYLSGTVRPLDQVVAPA